MITVLTCMKNISIRSTDKVLNSMNIFIITIYLKLFNSKTKFVENSCCVTFLLIFHQLLKYYNLPKITFPITYFQLKTYS